MCRMFASKHTETKNMLKSRLLYGNKWKKMQTLWENNLRILRIQHAKFSECYFHMNKNIWREFQICISVTLTINISNHIGEPAINRSNHL